MIEQLEGQNTDVDILKTWFILDENAIPPVYVLQPISSRIPDFLSDVGAYTQLLRNDFFKNKWIP